MSQIAEQARASSTSSHTSSSLVVEPYLHRGPDRIYNPLTDRTILVADHRYETLDLCLAGGTDLIGERTVELADLERDGWLIPADSDIDGRFYLKYVSLEAHTICNQACYFCPVKYDPREPYFMPTEFFDEILGQLSEYRATIDGVKLINYNEPTVDKRFVSQVQSIKDAGLPPAVLSNGTGLTPKRVDAILEMGGMRYLSINISTLDGAKYEEDRGGDHLDLVLRNLDYMQDKPLAEEMELVVLGTGDDIHQRDSQAISDRYGASRFVIKSYEVMDRAGYLEVGLKTESPHQCLRGCDVVGSRPLQHLHITPYGHCVLCSEDYDHKYIVGDLRNETIQDVLEGPKLAQYRRWVYGREEAPDDFICRTCIFALSA